MKKLISILLIVCFSFTLLSCDKDTWKEKTAEGIADFAAPNIAKALTCTGTDAIKADVKKKIQELSWLKPEHAKMLQKGMLKSTTAEEKGIVGQLCVLAVASVLPSLINFGVQEIPEAWTCSGEGVQKTAMAIAKEACGYLP